MARSRWIDIVKWNYFKLWPLEQESWSSWARREGQIQKRRGGEEENNGDEGQEDKDKGKWMGA